MSAITSPKKGRSAVQTKNKPNPKAAMFALHANATAATAKRMSIYQGTVINTQITAKLGNAAVQKAIGAAFARLDPKIPERSQHFAWVDKFPALNPVGWQGYITKMQPAPGGWLVEINVSPIFAPESRNIAIMDQCVERWFYQGGALQQVPFAHSHDPRAAGALIID